MQISCFDRAVSKIRKVSLYCYYVVKFTLLWISLNENLCFDDEAKVYTVTINNNGNK